jgi:peptidoglycan/xylan/chitin deacetylase (PgdA/CDA1 family)
MKKIIRVFSLLLSALAFGGCANDYGHQMALARTALNAEGGLAGRSTDMNQMPITTKKAEFMLSFDDGPLPDATGRVLDALTALRTVDGRQVKAGFFLLADAPDDFWQRRIYYSPYEVWTNKGSIAKYPKITQRINQSGHIIGSHTAHHSWFQWPWLDTPDAMLNEFTEWEAVSKPVLGQLNPRMFRPPYLIVTESVRETARKLDYKIVMGEMAGDAIPGMEVEDIKKKTSSILAAWSKPYPCVLIFHDIFPVTYEHLYEIVSNLQKQGFSLVNFDTGRLGV